MKIKIEPCRRIRPMIYAYTTPDYAPHDGWTKIGYTDRQSVEERIKQQTHTADIRTHLEWKQEARYTDGSEEYFTDHDFHDYLTRCKGIERQPKTEWFRIDGAASRDFFYRFAAKDYGDLQKKDAQQRDYILRDEQKKAVDMTLAYVASGEEPREFLWNAKPRFGKTLAAYDFVRRLDARHVLIVTNRPSIANSWFDDFDKFIGGQTDYKFVSDTDALKERAVWSRAMYSDYLNTLGEAGEEQARMIAFESLQGLKGSVYFGGEHRKLEWIKNLHWDLLIIDEAHEGVDTYRTDKAFEGIRRDFTLHLSGTPFKAIAQGRFRARQIFHWSYADEQEAKRSFSGETANPYAALPKLHMMTYRLSKMIADETRKGLDLTEGEDAEYAFNLHAFFSTNERGKFQHEREVQRFLDALTQQKKFPFSTPELRAELAHTFWLLDRVDSCRAMAKLLAAHPVFGEYEVVLAAGDGRLGADEDAETKKSFDRVMEATKTHAKTITLSVGQLTTGVTVKPWTAVLMLSNMKSPSEYMQAAFRAQNPWEYIAADGKLYRKENAYLFDFAPERTLITYEKFANDLSAETANGSGTKAEHETNIRRMLNLFPIYGEDEDGEMVELDAQKVLTIPRSIKAEEVVHRGFMSNFLFQNIGAIFAAPAAAREILEKITPEENQGDRKSGAVLEDANDIETDESGNVKLDGGIVVSQTDAVFGKAVYEEVKSEILKVAESHETTPADTSSSAAEFSKEAETHAAKTAEAIASQVTAPLKEHIKNEALAAYGLTKTQADRLSDSMEKFVQEDFQRLAAEHAQEQKIARAEAEEALEKASSQDEIERVQKELEERIARSTEEFKHHLLEKAKSTLEEQKQKTIETLETRKAEERKKGVEDRVRAHLRGFARTIPSFIMAYSENAPGGGGNLRLANFDDYTPAEVFHEVTGITREEFRFLRDGGDYTDEATGEAKHFDGHLFNEIVFDDAIKNFLRKKECLSDYFDENHAEDIFDYIPPQKTNQIFTPRTIVKRMVASLEEENPDVFDDPEKTFVDFYMKSGLYITEIVKRLYRSEKLKAAHPDEDERLKHILERQVFGFAPSRIIYDIAMAYIFGFDRTKQRISRRNFVMADTAAAAKEGRLPELVEKHFGRRSAD